ncbi:MAG: sce7726 family protein [Bacteroidaceae bacterium]|nr:sce7726 family protein [Bacteroidaceae bacterium]
MATFDTAKLSKDQLRNFSSAFSRAVFSDILAHSDFSHLDWICGQCNFGLSDRSSYMDYLIQMYDTLSRYYRCEYVFKNEIINQLLLKKYGTKDTIAFNEFKVGDSIVDFAMMNGESKAFEIKTSFDTPRRLRKQMCDYRRVFNRCYVVVDADEIEHYASYVDDTIGIIILKYEKGRILLDEYRTALDNDTVDPDVLMKCLRTNEYKSIVSKHFGTLPAVPDFEMYNACKEQMGHIEPKALNHLFLQEIKNRKSATGYLKNTPKELRQVMLSLNLTKSKQDLLIKRLYHSTNNSNLCITRI